MVAGTEGPAADRFHGLGVRVVDHVLLAQDTYRLRIECPEIATTIRVGQFVMVREHGRQDPLLGRAFALYDADDSCIDIVYLVHGKMTNRLRQLRAGDRLDLWGPLGNGFSMHPTDHLILVAGGIGQTPFLAMAREYLGSRYYGRTCIARGTDPVRSATRVTLCYGVRAEPYFAGTDAFQDAQVELRLATDDGSHGHHGRVTDLLRQVLDEPSNESRRVCACGPEPMLEAVCAVMQGHPQIPVEVSLETPMACGIGICFSCVARVRQSDGSWDYRRTCIEGPVFAGHDIVWSV